MRFEPLNGNNCKLQSCLRTVKILEMLPSFCEKLQWTVQNDRLTPCDCLRDDHQVNSAVCGAFGPEQWL